MADADHDHASDHELMRRSREGDTAAFETLVRRWERPLARILTRLTTEPGRAGPASFTNEIDDLSQEVFLRVLTAARRYRDDWAFSTWLYRIALNVARDAARRRRTRWKLIGNHRPPEPGRAGPESPAERAGREEIAAQVARALAELPAKLREPLVLRHYGDMTFAQVADVLGLPVSTVKSRVETALRRLRSELKQRGIDEQELES